MSRSKVDTFCEYVKLAFDREEIVAKGFEFLSNQLKEGISPDAQCEAYSKFFVKLIMWIEDHQQEEFLCQCLAAIMTITNSTETNMMHLKNFLGHLGHSECSSSVRKMAVHYCVNKRREIDAMTMPKSPASINLTTGGPTKAETTTTTSKSPTFLALAADGSSQAKTASIVSKSPAPIDLTSSQLDHTKAATTKPKQRPMNPRGIKRGIWQAIVKSAYQELDAMNLVEQTPKHYKALMRR